MTVLVVLSSLADKLPGVFLAFRFFDVVELGVLLNISLDALLFISLENLALDLLRACGIATVLLIAAIAVVQVFAAVALPHILHLDIHGGLHFHFQKVLADSHAFAQQSNFVSFRLVRLLLTLFLAIHVCGRMIQTA